MVGLESGFRIRVADDESGFLDAPRKCASRHFGLAGMRERAVLAGGWLRVRREPGDGSTEAWLPAQESAARARRANVET